MPGLLPDVDDGGLLEYSVVYTDRALNHMSQSFGGVMNDISALLKQAYHAEAVAVIPGSGSFAMEGVARQFATNKRCMVIRNGWFSFRWTEIFSACDIPSIEVVLKARPVDDSPQAPFIPIPVEEVVAKIDEQRPEVIFAPHVETASGIILPDDYIQTIADAIHKIGGLFVLDCIASGTLWVDMKALGVDILISAPQKGWSAPACCGLVMFSPLALEKMASTTSTSFVCDLRKWLEIMQAYENGGHAYHTTMPTCALKSLAAAMHENKDYGFDKIKQQQQQLGDQIRALLAEKGIKSVAAPGFAAPSVVVSYTSDSDIQNGQKFVEKGMQIAAGVPLRCDEPEDFKTFRLGLFGLDKLQNIDRTIANLDAVLEQVISDD